MVDNLELEVGKSIVVQRTVKKEDTALNYGSGKLDNLFATPKLIALMIDGAVKLIDEELPEGFITVGKMSKVIHEKPTLLGTTVSVEVKLEEFDGNKLFLKMTAYDELGVIGKGTHERYIVNKDSLLKKAEERAEKLENRDF